MPSDLSRRELLATFLGLPVALAACRSRARRVPDGELVHRAELLGHRIREAGHVEVPRDRWERVPVVIVGAGIAGLSAAWRLLRAGFDDFVLLELDDAAGGTAKSGRSEVSAYPWGAHYVTAPMKEERAMIALLDELGALDSPEVDGEPVVREEHLCREPNERVFANGLWHEGLYLHDGESKADVAALAAFRAELDRLASLRDGAGRRAFAIPIARSSDDPELRALDRMSMGEWLDRRGLVSPRLRWLVDYACRDDYGLRAEHTSAWAGLFYYVSRMRHGGAEAQPIVTWPEGNGRLVAHLLSKVKAKVRLAVGATEIVPTDGPSGAGVDVIALRASGEAIGIHAERVIFAGPQFIARRVVRSLREAGAPHLDEFRYGAWMVANLTLSARPKSRGFPYAWDNVLYDSPALGYVVATHQRCLDHGPTVLTYYHPLCDEDPNAARRRLLVADRADWADVALSDLSRAHPDLRELTTRLDVIRLGHAMIQPRPGFLFGGAREAAMREERGVHFAHTDLSGVALFEEALDHGVRAAEEVLAARGVRTPSLR